MAEPFPADPIRAACPGCGTPVLFPRLHGLAPGSMVSCDCPQCGRKVSVVSPGAQASKARRAAVLLVALAVIAAAILALML